MASTLTQLKYDDDIEYYFTEDFDMNEMKCIEIEPEMLDDLKCGKFGDLYIFQLVININCVYKKNKCILLQIGNSW